MTVASPSEITGLSIALANTDLQIDKALDVGDRRAFDPARRRHHGGARMTAIALLLAALGATLLGIGVLLGGARGNSLGQVLLVAGVASAGAAAVLAAVALT